MPENSYVLLRAGCARRKAREIFEMEGDVRERINLWNRAEKAYPEALRIGSHGAATSLNAIYARGRRHVENTDARKR